MWNNACVCAFHMWNIENMYLDVVRLWQAFLQTGMNYSAPEGSLFLLLLHTYVHTLRTEGHVLTTRAKEVVVVLVVVDRGVEEEDGKKRRAGGPPKIRLFVFSPRSRFGPGRRDWKRLDPSNNAEWNWAPERGKRRWTEKDNGCGISLLPSLAPPFPLVVRCQMSSSFFGWNARTLLAVGSSNFIPSGESLSTTNTIDLDTGVERGPKLYNNMLWSFLTVLRAACSLSLSGLTHRPNCNWFWSKVLRAIVAECNEANG